MNSSTTQVRQKIAVPNKRVSKQASKQKTSAEKVLKRMFEVGTNAGLWKPANEPLKVAILLKVLDYFTFCLCNDL